MKVYISCILHVFHLVTPADPVTRFTNTSDLEWFEKTVVRVAEEELPGDCVEIIQSDHYFTDFMR